MSHAILSPSAASRWLTCTPSARLEQQFPESTSEAAEEGTLAHAIAELELSMCLGRIAGKKYKADKDKLKAHALYTPAMEEYIGAYVTFVMEKFNKARAGTNDALIHLEQKIDLTRYIPEGFGTADVAIIADGTLYVIDLKFGKGVPVSAVENKQLKVYGLGALEVYDIAYDIDRVCLIIHQTRLDSITEFFISVDDLRAWADTELEPKAKLAFEGAGEFVAGLQCRFCKAKAVCRANADYNLELAKYDFKPSPLLTAEEIADILGRVDHFTKWAASVEEHALAEALKGTQYPGWKLVKGKSNRIYANVEKIEAALLATKAWTIEQIYEPKKLLGITAMEKAIGKASFAETVGPYIVKPEGKPTLVPAADKRPAFSTAESAAADFAEPVESAPAPEDLPFPGH